MLEHNPIAQLLERTHMAGPFDAAVTAVGYLRQRWVVGQIRRDRRYRYEWCDGFDWVANSHRPRNLNHARLGAVGLSDRDLVNVRMAHAYLEDVDLREADLRNADLRHTIFTECDLSGADLSGASLRNADLSGCNLDRTHLNDANLSRSNLAHASLQGASLVNVSLVGASIEAARFNGARVYGVSAWDLEGEPLDQTGLILSPHPAESPLIVDEIRVAQLLHLLLENSNLRRILDSTARKAVLILGRFSTTGMLLIDALRAELRTSGLIPIVFDFERPSSSDLSKTIEILGRLVGAIIVDLTDPSCVPYELRSLVPEVNTPVIPLILTGQRPFAMFGDLLKYPWVREPAEYSGHEDARQVVSDVVELLGPG